MKNLFHMFFININNVYACTKEKTFELTKDSYLVVPEIGLEPIRYRYRRILSPLRLPFHHSGTIWSPVDDSNVRPRD